MRRSVPHRQEADDASSAAGTTASAAAAAMRAEMAGIGAGDSFARLLAAAEAAAKESNSSSSSSTPSASPFSLANVCWLLAALALLGYTDLVPLVLFDSSRLRRGWLAAGAAFIGVTLCLALYCAIYLTTYLRVPSSQWEHRHPALIPIAAASFVLGSLCLTFALWPVYHLLTLPILFTLLVACAILVAMIPTSLLPDAPEPEDAASNDEDDERKSD